MGRDQIVGGSHASVGGAVADCSALPGETKEMTIKLNRHYQSEAEVSSHILQHTSHRTTLLSKMSGQ